MGGIIEDILDMEWEMFQDTQNIGGRAGCQDDRATFFLMRRSQWAVMEKSMLESYLMDLWAAKMQGRNLVAEKYAYMMEEYDPKEFAAISSLLPERSVRKRQLAEEITKMYLKWYEEIWQQFPLVLAGGRKLKSQEDSMGNVSIETYQKGELFTYSEETLALYDSYANRCREEGKNLVRQTYEEIAKGYGYLNLQEAEQRLREKV